MGECSEFALGHVICKVPFKYFKWKNQVLSWINGARVQEKV